MIQRADRLIPHRKLPRLAQFPASFALALLMISLAGSWANAWRGGEVYALIAAVAGFAALAALMALMGLALIWVAGGYGMAAALGALARAAIALFPAAAIASLSALLPQTVDVTTNLDAPIAPPSATINYRDATRPAAAAWHEQSVPLSDLYFAAEPDAVFDALMRLVERRGWRVIRVDKPVTAASSLAGDPARLEATRETIQTATNTTSADAEFGTETDRGEADRGGSKGFGAASEKPIAFRLEAEVRTPLLGLKSDLAIEVRSSPLASVVSMRAIARYMDHDLGVNTYHLKRLTATLQAMFEPPTATGDRLDPAGDASDRSPDSPANMRGNNGGNNGGENRSDGGEWLEPV